jgi:hypothetical protein
MVSTTSTICSPLVRGQFVVPHLRRAIACAGHQVDIHAGGEFLGHQCRVQSHGHRHFIPQGLINGHIGDIARRGVPDAPIWSANALVMRAEVVTLPTR